MRDMVSRIKPFVAVAAAVLAATPSVLTVDRQGFDSLAFVINTGVGGITFDTTNKIEFVMTHSDDGTTYTQVAASDIQGNDAPASVTNGVILAFTSAQAAAAVKEIGYVGNKRYVRVLPTFSGTHGTGTGIAVTALAGHPFAAPV